MIGRHFGGASGKDLRDEADAHFGFLGAFVSTDNPTSRALAQELVGWRLSHAGLISDIDEGRYFAQVVA